MNKTNWTPEQLAIIDAVAEFRQNIIVNAVAGSGKTSVLVESAKQWSAEFPGLTGFACAFNKDIAKTLQARLPKTFVASTLHSHGFKALKKKMGSKLKVGKFKFYDCADSILGKGWDEDEELAGLKPDIRRGVSLLKTLPLSRDQISDRDSLKSDLSELLSHQGIYFEKESQLDWTLEICVDILEESVQTTETLGAIDFDDMLFEAILRDANFDQHALVMLDECQDVSLLQMKIVEKTIMSGGRLLSVGDRNQAIYGWRGADSSSFAKISRDFECLEMPMTFSFRCPKLVVEEATLIVPEIRAPESAQDGLVEELGEKAFIAFCKSEAFTPANSALICRNRKPLISMAFRLRRSNIKSVVLGSDLGAILCGMILKWRANNALEIERKAALWRDAEMQKAREKKNYEALQSIEDRAECLIAICQNVDSSLNRKEIMKEIRDLFADEVKSPDILTLSTVHKAKGLEWQTVFFYLPELIPNKYAKKDWQLEQESNIRYVGVTRSLNELFYVSPNFDKEEEEESYNHDNEI